MAIVKTIGSIALSAICLYAGANLASRFYDWTSFES
jgi:hypothetical protein